MFKATLKSLLSRKLRLVLSALAVVLGVMFVSGSFVLTDTLQRSFTDLFSSAFANVDVSVTPKAEKGKQPEPLTPQAISDVKSVAGVSSAIGDVQGSARPIGKNGKVITTSGSPRFGFNWTGTGQEKIRDGKAPAGENEVAVGGYLATTGGFKVGDDIALLTLEPKRTFKITGIYEYAGGRDSLGGELSVAFTEPVAQQLLLGKKDVFSGITVTAAQGTTDDALRDAVAAKLGSGYDVKTGAVLAKEQADQINEGLKFFNYVLLGFAGIALFVGIFIILNTFSIIVAQRTRELALLRSMGASRGQVIGSVVLEALVIGLIASIVGLGAGIGIGALLAKIFSSVGGTDLQLASIGVPMSAIISSFAVGMIVTVVAAVMPALRASRIAPVAAMREAATPDRPLTKITITGALVAAAGGTSLAFGFNQASLPLIFGGILVAFVGVALLTPIMSKPMVSLIGRLLSWSMPGLLGRRNSARNPRRTAITAAALMVGISLITGVSVVLTSATKSIEKLATGQLQTDLIVSGEGQMEGEPATFRRDVLTKIEKTDGVKAAVGWSQDGVLEGENQLFAVGVTDLPAMATMFALKPKSGTIAPLKDDQLALPEEMAAEKGWSVGSKVTLQLAKGEPKTYTVGFIWVKSQVLQGALVLPESASANFRSDQIAQAFVQVSPGVSAADVQKRVEPLFADNPEITVQDRSAFVKQTTSQFDTVLLMIQILLALAILIAVLGVINTLALSVIERTRELGLLRAIGMRRSQVMRMITVESVVISVFGAVLGLAVGLALGIATVQALKDQGISEIGLPWMTMVQYLVVAAFVGVIAAILPAIRAARLNVLDAIAYE
ncbi:ABC transporter permease [Lentzea flaviverrucosa]|uniref:Putative ABC transport system permease protein n=1 Tax=Lentzea flaviverrucosa TaxID=200379 RepID=A0A1H9KGD4_9PSEU|nr:ABC transporter permease [Lentzea flaviverrucosa]RDI17865.1 putative ABC transport system permease protein [Lentzea flaviverrucosa]SEQ98119.1 putative ABC transport system permease protein [Lentzea flaviverrucosa]